VAHEHEDQEWQSAVAEMNETDRAATEYAERRSMGLCGDREDALYGNS
jgi:hypothetical protein